MPVCRVIFRVDFDTCFGIMDRPGSVARILLQSSGEGFFKELREERQRREVIAVSDHENKQTAYSLTVSVNSIIFTYEIVKGIELSELRSNNIFQTLTSTVSEIRREFEVKSEARIGFRIFYFGKILDSLELTKDAFRGMIDGKYLEAAESAIGQAIDYGISVDGKRDNVSYRLRTGPYRGAEEGHNYLEVLKSEFEKENSFSFVCDLDQYEVRTKYGHDLKIWKPYIQQATALLNNLESCLREGRR